MLIYSLYLTTFYQFLDDLLGIATSTCLLGDWTGDNSNYMCTVVTYCH